METSLVVALVSLLGLTSARAQTSPKMKVTTDIPAPGHPSCRKSFT
jgi:hypothetical protein